MLKYKQGERKKKSFVKQCFRKKPYCLSFNDTLHWATVICTPQKCPVVIKDDLL